MCTIYPRTYIAWGLVTKGQVNSKTCNTIFCAFVSVTQSTRLEFLVSRIVFILMSNNAHRKLIAVWTREIDYVWVNSCDTVEGTCKLCKIMWSEGIARYISFMRLAAVFICSMDCSVIYCVFWENTCLLPRHLGLFSKKLSRYLS